MEMLRGLSKKGITVIMASHDINLVTRYCDKIMLLSQGVITDYGRPNDVITEESAKKVFDIDVRVIQDGGVNYVLPRPPGDDEIIFKVNI
jgi:iron complex transport system ATP-binding protein